VFAALDLLAGLSLRAVGLESPVHRGLYYAGALALGVGMRARPALAPWLAMGESTMNLTLLMAAVLVPIWSLGESLDAAGVGDLPERVVNLTLSGSVLVFSFYQAQWRARSQR
jgi:hypothetical protein